MSLDLSALQLNVEGLSAAKREVRQKLATDLSPSVLLLQETHSTQDSQLPIPGYTVVSHQHHRQYGIATYVTNDLEASELCSSHADSPVYWNAIRIGDLVLVNVYKPPEVQWPNPPLPSFPCQTLYLGDFNSPHTTWAYSSDSPQGDAILNWMEELDLICLFDPKQPSSFQSARWNSCTNPDLAFISRGDPDQTVHREVLHHFPRTQHRPSLIRINQDIERTNTSPSPRWNFRKAKWQVFTELVDANIPNVRPHPTSLDEEYETFCNSITQAAKLSIPRGSRKNYIPCWSDECESLYRQFLVTSEGDHRKQLSDELFSKLNTERQTRWNDTLTNIDFSRSSRVAWKTFKQLTSDPSLGKRQYQVTANQVAQQLLVNGKCPGDRTFTRQIRNELRSISTSPTVDYFHATPFTLAELEKAIKACKTGKAPGPDNVHPEYLHHLGPKAKEFLLSLMNRCLSTCHIPKIWRKAKVVAIQKPGKPADDAKSYRPISLLCLPYKLFERLILERITPLVEDFLPQEQAGFRPGRSTMDQVLLLTQDIERGFEDRQKTGIVLVDLTAAYDTVWHRGLALKLHKHLPNRHLVNMILELINNRSFTLHLGDQKSRNRRLKNGLPQGSVLAPTLFNIYTSDLPPTRSKKYVYADDICLGYQDRDFDSLSSILTSDLASLCQYFKHWRLKLSEPKTTSSCFHLDNHQARRELDVLVDNRRLAHNPTPTYLGVTLDRTLSFRSHLSKLSKKVTTRGNLVRKVAGTSWGASAQTLRTTSLALVYSAAEYCSPVWEASCHTEKVDVALRANMRTISGTLKSTPKDWLPVLCNIAPPHLRRTQNTLRTSWRAKENRKSLIHHLAQQDPAAPSRLISRKPFFRRCHSDIPCPPVAAQHKAAAHQHMMELWDEEWGQAECNSTSLRNPDGRTPPGFDLDRREWCTLNRIITGHGRSAHMMHKYGLASSPVCDCGAPAQTCHHIVEECPRRRFPGGLAALAECGTDAKIWLRGLDLQL